MAILKVVSIFTIGYIVTDPITNIDKSLSLSDIIITTIIIGVIWLWWLATR